MKKFLCLLILASALSNIASAVTISMPGINISVGGKNKKAGSVKVGNIKIDGIDEVDAEDNGAGSVERTDDTYSIKGAGNTKTVTLNGEAVSIQGASNTLTIKGNVSTISIQGAGNTVYVDSVTKIQIKGASNKVIYKSSPTKSGKPSVSISGAGSYVSKK